MTPSMKSFQWGIKPLGMYALLIGFVAYYYHLYWLAVLAALVVGLSYYTQKEYHIEKNNYARTLAELVGNVGPRDARFREQALLTISRLEQIARKSQGLDNELLATINAETVKFRLKLEETIIKEGL